MHERLFNSYNNNILKLTKHSQLTYKQFTNPYHAWIARIFKIQLVL